MNLEPMSFEMRSLDGGVLRINMPRLKRVLYWCVVWIPLGFVFQANPHIPFPAFAWLAPWVGFFALFDAGMRAFEGNTFNEVMLPFLVFWIVAILLLIFPTSKELEAAKVAETDENKRP